jgi:Ca2+/Na+ antiporter
LAGAVFYLSHQIYAPYLFALGAVGITICYMTAPYKTLSYRMRRLSRMNVFAGIVMIAASVFMFKQQMEWVVCLLVSAMLQLYTSFVMKDKES